MIIYSENISHNTRAPAQENTQEAAFLFGHQMTKHSILPVKKNQWQRTQINTTNLAKLLTPNNHDNKIIVSFLICFICFPPHN